MKSITLLCVLGACISLGAAYPLHASCKITWTFGVSCTTVHDKLVATINKYTNDPADCGSGEKCFYKLSSETTSEIKATHETPVKHYMDDLSFALTGDTQQCSVKAYSSSETWYAYLDYGTNYCNLRNLADLSGLSADPGFKESTSDSVCTQYSSRNCNKY